MSSFSFIKDKSPKKQFKSAFDVESSSKNNQPKFNFSSSFIMEDLVGQDVMPPPRRRLNNTKSTTKSYFSFIDDFEEKPPKRNSKRSTQSSPGPNPPISQSAFGFMNFRGKKKIQHFLRLSYAFGFR